MPPPTNIFVSAKTTLTYKRPRQQQKQKKVEMKSDWSIDSYDRRDNQARKPIRHDTTSDWETKIEDDQHILVEASLRRPNTMTKILTNWTRQINNSFNEIQVNQTCVEPRPRFKSFQDTKEYWQKQSKWTNNKAIDKQDEAEQQEEEEDQIKSDENDEKQGKSLEDVEETAKSIHLVGYYLCLYT